MIEQIDLELLTTCGFRKQTLADLPKAERHPANIRWVDRDGNRITNLPQFTKDIGACFQFLISEMNRRGFQFILEQLPDKTWLCTFIISNAMDGDTFMGVDQQPQVAISLAAEKVIKSMEGK